MSSGIDVDWDVDFWASRYPAADLAIYRREIRKDPFESLRGLWRWKSLHRTNYAPEDVKPFLADAAELSEEIDSDFRENHVREMTDIFERLQSKLCESGPLSPNSNAVVTPQFLFHVVDSDCGYSGRFPILDAMVARAHIVRTSDNTERTLPGQLTYSPDRYQDLIQFFHDRCETDLQVAKLERALFVQGRAIARYREIEQEYDSVRKVPVGVARKYIENVERQVESSL